jgi:phospholipid/cholesterol/gamma-HCH transport system substrate-binding protein
VEFPERRVLIGIGVFLLTGILLLTYFIFKIQGMSLKSCTPYRLYFSDITGIPERSEVRTRGVVVGRVEGFRLLTDQVEVRICLTEHVPLHTDAMAVVRPKSLLGERFVDLRPGTADTFLPPGSAIVNTLNPVRVEDLGELLSPFLKGETFSALGESLRILGELFARNPTEMEETLRAVQKTLKVFADLLGENRQEIHTLLTHLSRLTQSLAGGQLSPEEISQILRLVKENLADLSQILKDLRSLSQTHPQLVQDLTVSLSLLRRALERVAEADPDRFLLLVKRIIQEEGITVRLFGTSEEELKRQIERYKDHPRPSTAPTSP